MKKLMLARGCGGLAGRRARTCSNGEDGRGRHHARPASLRAPVTVQAGDSVTWTNKDTATHQVICATCPFNSPALAAGQTFTYPFAKAGKYSVVDPLNKNKKMTVTVAAAPATVSVGGRPARPQLRRRDDHLGHALDRAGEPEGRHPRPGVRRQRREGRRHGHDDYRRGVHVPGEADAEHELPGAVRRGQQRRDERARPGLDPPDRQAEAERAAPLHRPGDRRRSRSSARP